MEKPTTTLTRAQQKALVDLFGAVATFVELMDPSLPSNATSVHVNDDGVVQLLMEDGRCAFLQASSYIIH